MSTPKRLSRNPRVRRSLCAVAAVCLLLAGAATRLAAGEPAPLKGEELLPARTLAALLVPDLAAARAAAAQTRVAEMLAQPEMQAFLQPPLARVREIYGELHQKTPGLPDLADLDAGLLTGELAVSVYRRADGEQPPLGLLAIVTPKDAVAFARAMGPFLGGQLPPEGQQLPMAMAADAPAIAWAKGRFFFCQPQADLEPLLQRLKNPAAGAPGESLAGQPAFATARGQLKAPAAFLYADIPGGLEIGLAGMARRPERLATAQKMAHEAGLDNLTGVAAGVTFSGGETLLETFVGLADPQARRGLLALCGSAVPISAAGLKIAAADAPYVNAGSCDCSALLPAVRAVLNAAGPAPAADFERGLAQVNQLAGFDLEKDLLQNLGPEMVTAETRLDTGLPLSWMPGLVTSVAAKDPAKVEACLGHLKVALAAFPPAKQIGLELRQVTHAGRAIYYLALPLSGLPVVLAVAGDRLLVGTSVNAVRRGLEQLAAPADVRANPRFQETLARLTGRPFDAQSLPPAFSFGEDESLGGGTLVCAGLGLFASIGLLGGMAEEAAAGGAEVPHEAGAGLDYLTRPSGKIFLDILGRVDLGLWPDEGFFKPYRRARGSVLESRPQGLLVRCELPPPLPGIGRSFPAVFMVAPVLAGIALPAVARAREAARRASSANNLKQIAMASIMYADAAEHQGKFPDDPLELVPNYFQDLRVFRNPRFDGEDVGYVYAAGSGPQQGENILAFENVPAGSTGAGRNVAFVDAHVEWLEEGQFQAALEATRKNLKAVGVEMKLIPISCGAVQKKFGGANR